MSSPATRLGANSYVRKPVDFDQFAEAVRAAGLVLAAPQPAPAHQAAGHRLTAVVQGVARRRERILVTPAPPPAGECTGVPVTPGGDSGAFVVGRRAQGCGG